MLDLHPFTPAEGAHFDTLVDIWNATCGPELSVSRRFVEFNTRGSEGAAEAGCLALSDDRPVGFVLASAAARFGNAGWVDAIAVMPSAQRRGAGTALLGWAESWLAEQDCRRVRLGGSLRPFTPGLTAELGSRSFFERRGYQGAGDVWDVAHDLRGYNTPASTDRVAADVRSLEPGQEDALREFLGRAFPGRWAYECDEFFREGGRASDYLTLWRDGRVEGFCQLTFVDSLRPLDRFYMQRLPQPWGQLGPIGVGEVCRGQGYGGAVLDAGLRHLRDHGIAGCVIDWTNLVDFYGKFGFTLYRQYTTMAKDLS
jgi:GNAT superfamily N-acetyltransferase